MLYTEINTQCDKFVGLTLTVAGIFNLVQPTRPWRNFLSPEFGKKFQKEYIIFGDMQISLQHSVRSVEGSFSAKTSLINSSVSIELRLVTDRLWLVMRVKMLHDINHYIVEAP